MFSRGLLFEVSNPLYVIFTTGDLALVVNDVYVVIQLYLVKKQNPVSRKILHRLGIVMTLGATMKAATAPLFLTHLDPNWFYYLVTFPFSLILYEVVNTLWIQMAKVSVYGKPDVQVQTAGSNSRKSSRALVFIPKSTGSVKVNAPKESDTVKITLAPTPDSVIQDLELPNTVKVNGSNPNMLGPRDAEQEGEKEQ